MDYGGLLEARIRETKCRISPIPNRGLGIPVTLVVKKGTSSGEVFSKMKDFLEEYYIEPELIVKKKDSDSESSDEDIPAEDTTNMAVSEEQEQEQEIEKDEEMKRESDIVVIDD